MNNLGDLVFRLITLVDLIIPILIGLAVVLFMYGLLRYIISKNSEDRKEAINVIVYGVVALFVMVTIWGIVEVVGYSLGIDIGKTIYDKPIIIKDLIKK
jgi:uncharacterized membrane protein